MTKVLATCLVGAYLLAACAPQGPGPTDMPTAGPSVPTRTPPPTATAVPPTEEIQERYRGQPLPVHQGEFFSTSGECTPCHINLLDEFGEDVSPDAEWRASTMANAARNPFWQALVRAETLLNPETADQIEDFCTHCHMPMASVTARAHGEQNRLFEAGYLDPEHPLHQLAMDGISCALCHQIREANLGLPGSYSGGFEIDTDLPLGERLIYGTFNIDAQQSEIMRSVSGYLPEQGLHVQRSELCATCHMQFNPNGFPQQTPYFEWWYSAYRNDQSCQDCHMPEVDSGVQLAATSTELRSPFPRHTFLGGNAYLLELMVRFAQEIRPVASSDQLREAREGSLELLQRRSVKIEVERADLSGQWITLDLQLVALTGHKFPTGFPSRRAWVHLLVEDAQGEVVFESGGLLPDGTIAGDDQRLASGAFEPHHLAILQEDQVQIYEAIMADETGAVTRDSMRAEGYLKDNRLLPAGLDKEAAISQIRVHGAAAEDIDFDGGGDALRFSVNVGQAPAPYGVTIELLYQSLPTSWVELLRGLEAPEIERFLRYVDELPNYPVVVDQTSMTLP